jgi:esterase/lipase superfamily enzyme
MPVKLFTTFFLIITFARSPALAADTWLLDENFNLACAGGTSFQSLAASLAGREQDDNDHFYAVRANQIIPLDGIWIQSSEPAMKTEPSGAMSTAKQLEWMTEQAPEASEIHWLTAADNLVESGGMLAGLARFAATGAKLNIHLPDAPQSRTQQAWSGIRFHGLACDVQQDVVDREVLIAVTQIAADRLGIPVAALGRRTSFLSLGADEMTRYEINATAVDRFAVQGLVGELSYDTAQDLSLAISEVQDIAASVHSRSLPSENKVIEQTVFYSTNRQSDPQAVELDERFSGERASGKKLAYGAAVVSIPASHRRGLLEGPFLGMKIFEDAQSHILLQSLNTLDENGFYDEISTSLSKSSGGDWDQQAIVFIHGFNVPFTEAVVRTAQVAYDIGFTGAPILFSWPSDASLFGYMSDREDAAWSVNYLREFLETTLARLEAKKVHLIAHSMGNQVLIGALQQMQLAKPRSNLFESVILAAPDFDAELFADQIAPLVRDVTNRWTIYTSDKDAALDISLEVNNNRRLGQPVTPIAEFDVIDATGIEVSPWSVPEFHSYYATKQQVISDIRQALSGVDAASRGLKQQSRQGIVFYTMN